MAAAATFVKDRLPFIHIILSHVSYCHCAMDWNQIAAYQCVTEPGISVSVWLKAWLVQRWEYLPDECIICIKVLAGVPLLMQGGKKWRKKISSSSMKSKRTQGKQAIWSNYLKVWLTEGAGKTRGQQITTDFKRSDGEKQITFTLLYLKNIYAYFYNIFKWLHM